MYGWRARIGIIYPSTGLKDHDFYRMAPPGVSVHIYRVVWVGTGTADDIKSMSETSNLEHAARLLAGVGPSCVTWADTSGSFLFGSGGDQAQVSAMSKAAGVPASTTSTAILAALTALRLTRVVVASPYRDDVNDPLVEFLTVHKAEVLRLEALEFSEADMFPLVARVDRETQYSLVKHAWSPGAEGVVVPCTDFFDLDLIELLERDLGAPVIAANQATMWHALRLSGISDDIPGMGQLMQLPLPD